MNQILVRQAAALSRSIGLGLLQDDIYAALKLSTDPIAILKQFWAKIQGRTWDQAVTAASARAANKAWIENTPAKNLEATNDLVTLLMSSAVNAKQISDAGDLATANDLNRTWVVIAKRMGIDKPTQAEVDKMKSQASAEIAPVIIIVGIIAAALAITAIYITLIYFASQVIDDVLSKIECDRELIRIHEDFNKVVERHNADPKAPWTDDDNKLRDKLIAQQEFVAAGCTKPKPGVNPWPYVIGATVLTVGTLGVVYRKEIGGWFSRKRG